MDIPKQVLDAFQRQGMTKEEIYAAISQGHETFLHALAHQQVVPTTPKTPQENLQDLEAILKDLQQQSKQSEQ